MIQTLRGKQMHIMSSWREDDKAEARTGPEGATPHTVRWKKNVDLMMTK